MSGSVVSPEPRDHAAKPPQTTPASRRARTARSSGPILEHPGERGLDRPRFGGPDEAPYLDAVLPDDERRQPADPLRLRQVLVRREITGHTDEAHLDLGIPRLLHGLQELRDPILADRAPGSKEDLDLGRLVVRLEEGDRGCLGLIALD